jgi:hypothetical protein
MTEGGSTLNQLFDIVEEPVTPQTRFVSPRVRHLHDWWRSVRGDFVPHRDAFDIVEHREIVGHVFLVDCLPGGDFVFRLLGEEVIRILGDNKTGETVKRGEIGEYGTALHEYYRSIVEEARCKHSHGSLKFAGREFRRFEGVDCPLTLDGRTVGMIIGVMDLVD